MTKEKTPKVYKDHKGNIIPSGYLFKIDKDKDSAARRFHKEALKLSERLKEFKAEVLKKCDELYQRALEENRITIRDNSKGGYSIMTTDRDIKIEVTVSEFQRFDNNVDIARLKLKEYLNEITEGSNEELQVLVNSAFETSRGQMDVKKVSSLFKLNIKHPKWKEAMELIQKSIYTNNSKRYVRIWERDQNGEYKVIVLDFAAL